MKQCHNNKKNGKGINDTKGLFVFLLQQLQLNLYFIQVNESGFFLDLQALR